MMIRKRFVVFLALVLGAAGCTSAPHPGGKPLPGMTFAHIRPVSLPVGEFSVLKSPEGTNGGAAAEQKGDPVNDFFMPVDRAVENYLNRKVRAMPSYGGRLVAEIEDASVHYDLAESTSPLGRRLGVGRFDEYNITVRLRLRALEADGFERAGRVISAHRRVRISEHLSIAEREREQFRALETLVSDLDRNMTRILDEMY